MPQYARLMVFFLVLGGCVSSGPFAPLSDAQKAAIEEACGHYPISEIKAAKSPRRVRYLACKSDVLARPETAEQG